MFYHGHAWAPNLRYKQKSWATTDRENEIEKH